MRITAAAFALAIVLLASCGDANFVFIFNTGTVLTEPECRDEGGVFDFRDADGLVLLVVIDSDTTILLATSFPGTCDDIERGAAVQVNGTRNGTRLTADEVRLL